MKVKNIKEAWEVAGMIFPTDYIKDERRTERAGYDIYASAAEGYEYHYICDLGDRLELNMGSKTVNIWYGGEEFEEDKNASAKENLKAAIKAFADMAIGLGFDSDGIERQIERFVIRELKARAI